MFGPQNGHRKPRHPNHLMQLHPPSGPGDLVVSRILMMFTSYYMLLQVQVRLNHKWLCPPIRPHLCQECTLSLSLHNLLIQQLTGKVFPYTSSSLSSASQTISFCPAVVSPLQKAGSQTMTSSEKIRHCNKTCNKHQKSCKFTSILKRIQQPYLWEFSISSSSLSSLGWCMDEGNAQGLQETFHICLPQIHWAWSIWMHPWVLSMILLAMSMNIRVYFVQILQIPTSWDGKYPRYLTRF